MFVRADQALLDRLDKLCEQQKQERPGIALSRADIARMLLWGALDGKEDSR